MLLLGFSCLSGSLEVIRPQYFHVAKFIIVCTSKSSLFLSRFSALFSFLFPCVSPSRFFLFVAYIDRFTFINSFLSRFRSSLFITFLKDSGGEILFLANDIQFKRILMMSISDFSKSYFRLWGFLLH